MNQNVKTALIIGGVIIALIVVLPWVFGGYGYGMIGSGMMGGFGTMGVVSIIWLIVLGLIIWVVVALVRGVSQPGGSDSASSRPDSALEVLKKRYARGEINKEEYEEKKKDLT